MSDVNAGRFSLRHSYLNGSEDLMYAICSRGLWVEIDAQCCLIVNVKISVMLKVSCCRPPPTPTFLGKLQEEQGPVVWCSFIQHQCDLKEDVVGPGRFLKHTHTHTPDQK